VASFKIEGIVIGMGLCSIQNFLYFLFFLNIGAADRLILMRQYYELINDDLGPFNLN